MAAAAKQTKQRTKTKAPARKSKASASIKTRPEATPVSSFLARLPDAQQRADSEVLIAMMRKATGCEPVMWGSSIVGFDRYHYRYDSGHEGDMALVGFSPRSRSLSLYLMPGFEQRQELLAKLGKHDTGKACLYIKQLSDVDLAVLEELVRTSVAEMRRLYPT
jgi:hypothetical protein